MERKITLNRLSVIYHPKGDVMHALKKSDNGFAGFEEAYFTTIKYGEIKGWKLHKKMTMNLIVPSGSVMFFIYNELLNKTFNYELGSSCYNRLTISPMLWVAFKGQSSGLNLILNLSNLEHDPEEAENAPLDTFKLV